MQTSPTSESSGTWTVNPGAQGTFRAWHVLMCAAGLILALSFFLPLLDAPLGAPVNMIQTEFHLWWDDAGIPIDHLFFAFCCFVACHLLGGLMAANSAACLAGRTHLAQTFSMLLAILVIMIGAGLLWTAPASHGGAFRIGSYWSLSSTLVAGLAALAYVIWASRLGSRAFPCYEFAGCLAVVAYWGYQSLYGMPIYGTYVALAASMLLLIGSVATARHPSHRSWWETLSRLVTCQVGYVNAPLPGPVPATLDATDAPHQGPKTIGAEL